jgi:hypothetical protein
MLERAEAANTLLLRFVRRSRPSQIRRIFAQQQRRFARNLPEDSLRNHSGAPHHPTPYHPTPQRAEWLIYALDRTQISPQVLCSLEIWVGADFI